MSGPKLGALLPKKIVVFDTETTGVDPETARIVTAFIGLMDTASGQILQSWDWLVNPGIEIPKGASDVHGVTTERARADGLDAKEAIYQIIQRLDILQREGWPIIVMNASYDFTVVDRETVRHWPTLRPYEPKRVIDPMVLDRAFDKYRAGSRKLVDLAAVYGVPVEANAHDAAADCLMAGRVAIKLMGHSRVVELDLDELHAKQIPTKRNQARELADYWENKKLPKMQTRADRAELLASIKSVRESGGYWPMKPRPEGESA